MRQLPVSSSAMLFTKKPHKRSRHLRPNFPDPRTRQDINCHHHEIREDDPGRPLKKDKGDGAQPALHSTRRRWKSLNSLCWKLIFQYERRWYRYSHNARLVLSKMYQRIIETCPRYKLQVLFKSSGLLLPSAYFRRCWHKLLSFCEITKAFVWLLN